MTRPAADPSPTPDSGAPDEGRALRTVVALYPPTWRRRFERQVEAMYADLLAEDPRQARRFVLDLLKNIPGTHFDAWRLARHRDRSAAPRALPRQEASVLDTFSRDLRFALRRLRRTPVVTFLAVATLALGIGGTTAVFSVVNGVLLEPMSAPNPETLVTLNEASESADWLSLSYDGFLDYQAQAESLEHLALVRSQSVSVTGGGEAPERIRGLFVTASFFDALDEEPSLGRAIRPGEDEPGGERTAVLSHGFWQRRFGGQESVLGQNIQLNNESHTIVGVMGPEFRFPFDTTEAWISLHTYPGTLDRENRTFFAIARLADGHRLSEVKEEMRVLAAGFAETYPDTSAGVTAEVELLSAIFTGNRTRDLLTALAAAVVMVLLIATANVANLQLAQATGRQREMVLRSAVGARQSRLVGQLLLENLLLASVGGLLGIGVAYAGVRALTSIGPGWLTGIYSIDPDPRVMLFALAVTLLTGFAFGLIPARRAAQVNLVDGLREGSQGSGTGRQGGRLRAGLVVAQVALAVVLVVGAGLLLRSIQNLSHTEVGFDTENMLTVQFRLPGNKYDTDEKVIAFFDRAFETVEAIPGVTGVASAFGMPFTGDEGRAPILANAVDPGAEVEVPLLRANVVSPRYFEVMGIDRLAGRTFDDNDRLGGAPVTVISQQAADQLFPGQAAVGRTLSIRGDDTVYSVIGVVGDIYNRGIRDGFDPMVYTTYRQQPTHFATLGARTLTDPHALSASIRAAMWEIDADQPLWEVMTQEERIAGWMGSDRFLSTLVGLFAIVALALAAVGIGGVIAYTVALRRREMGVRVSLGASRRQIAQLVLGQGFRWVGLGLALGMVGAVILRDLLDAFLYGMSATDASIFLVAPLVLAVVALLSILWPALRAAQVDPVRALKDD